MFSITISFDQAWIFGDGGMHSFAVHAVTQLLKEKYKDLLTVKDETFTDCQLQMETDTSPEALQDQLQTLIGNEIPGAAGGDEPHFSITIAGTSSEKPTGSGSHAGGGQAGTAAGKADHVPDDAAQGAAGQSGAEDHERHAEGRADVTPGAAHCEGAESSANVKESAASKDSAAGEKSTASIESAADKKSNASTAPVSDKNSNASTAPAADKKSNANAASATDTASAAAESAFDKIEALTGNEDFKALCRRIRNIAPMIHQHGTENIFRQVSYIFSIDPGDGYTTCLNLLLQFLEEEGLLEEGGSVKEIPLKAFEEQGSRESLLNASANAARYSASGIVSFDISGWLNRTDSTDFKKFLLPLFREQPKSIVVFHMPAVSDTLIASTAKDIEDVLPVQSITFPMRETAQIHKLTSGILDRYGFTMQGPAWDIFDHRIDAEKADGYFYGIHTLQKVAGQMIMLTEENNVEHGLNDKTISADAIASLDTQNVETHKSGMQQLEEMTGLQPVKDAVREIISRIKAARAEGLSSSFSMHMMFTGRPGTGKTTVARLIGLILKENHILRNGYFYEVRGRDLCGRYIGETAIITKQICEKALGSVLFIDEAYSLYRGDGETRDYGREALDTLIAEMENNRDDLVVILAGYPDEMQAMLSGNSGMRSRIPYHIEFPNYTRKELYQIFMGMIPTRLPENDSFAPAAKQFFESLPDDIYNRLDFGNARFDRNLYDRVFAESALRSTETGEKLTLTGEDFEKAAQKILPAAKPASKKKFGF